MTADFFDIPIIISVFTLLIGLVILSGLFVDWFLKFMDNVKSFSIVNVEIETIEKDKFHMKFTNPVIFYGGCMWLLLGFAVLFLQLFIQIDSNGLSIIGVGITIILYSYAIRVILDNDLSNKKLLKKIKQPLPKQEQIPDYKKLFNNEHPKIKYILYITIGLVVVSGIIAVLSVYGAYPFIDTIGFSFIFLTTAGAFNQLFVDKYERFVLNMEIERLLTFKSR